MRESCPIKELRERNLGQLLLRAGRYYSEICVARVQEFEPRFTVAHTRVLPHLAEGGVRPRELARRMGMSKQSVNQLLNDLESMGIVRREKDPEDGRGRLIVVTSEGRDSMSLGMDVLRGLETEISEEISPAEVEKVKAGLERVLAYLENKDS